MLDQDKEYRAKSCGAVVRFPVKDGVTIYKNSLVGLHVETGHVQPFTGRPWLIPVGLCMRQVTGDTSLKPAVSAEIRTDGPVIENVAIERVAGMLDIGKLVYATDDETFTLTRQGDDSTPIGRVHFYRGNEGYAELRLFNMNELMNRYFND